MITVEYAPRGADPLLRHHAQALVWTGRLDRDAGQRWGTGHFTAFGHAEPF